MRLNGRDAILRHLGLSCENKRGWQKMRHEYAPVLRYLPTHRVWCLSEDLDEARSLTANALFRDAKRPASGRPMGDQTDSFWWNMAKALRMPPRMLIPKRRKWRIGFLGLATRQNASGRFRSLTSMLHSPGPQTPRAPRGAPTLVSDL